MKIQVDTSIPRERIERILELVVCYQAFDGKISLEHILESTLENITSAELLLAGELIGRTLATEEMQEQFYNLNNYNSCQRKN